MLIRDGSVLVEHRSAARRLLPGATALPGGHMEPGESAWDALCRELMEETSLTLHEARYVCTLSHQDVEVRILHYFAVTRWSGTIETLEAASLDWLALERPQELDLGFDRTAIAELQRLLSNGGR